MQAGTQGHENTQIPSGLTFDRIASKDGLAFIKKGRVDINRFFQRERLSNPTIQEATQPLVAELEAVGGAAAKGASAEDIGMRVKVAHVRALKGMYKTGGDRGLLMRWLELPIIRFIDDKGGVGAVRKIRAAFIPRMLLSDLNITQRAQRGWGLDGRSPMNAVVEMTVQGSDLDRIVVFANGKQLRVLRPGRLPVAEPQTMRLSGDAYGVWSFVAYDKYGGRPYTKSYSFYPRIRSFRQAPNGTYLIGFMPGSAPHSLDRFFYAGGSNRSVNRDPMVSKF